MPPATYEPNCFNFQLSPFNFQGAYSKIAIKLQLKSAYIFSFMCACNLQQFNFAAQRFAQLARETSQQELCSVQSCIQKIADIGVSATASVASRSTKDQLHVMRMMQSTLIKSTRHCPKPLLSGVMFHLPLCHGRFFEERCLHAC